jgi:hypothetical protein
VRRSIFADSPSLNCNGAQSILSAASDLDTANKCTQAFICPVEFSARWLSSGISAILD